MNIYSTSSASEKIINGISSIIGDKQKLNIFDSLIDNNLKTHEDLGVDGFDIAIIDNHISEEIPLLPSAKLYVFFGNEEEAPNLLNKGYQKEVIKKHGLTVMILSTSTDIFKHEHFNTTTGENNFLFYLGCRIAFSIGISSELDIVDLTLASEHNVTKILKGGTTPLLLLRGK